MSEAMSEANGNMFEFRGGQYYPTDFGDAWGVGDACPRGYFQSQDVGDDCGLHFKLYESDSSAASLSWIVTFSTAGAGCDIKLYTWPDLIMLLSQLSSIALAGLINTEWIEAVDKLLEPTKREIQRRRAPS